MHMNWFTRLIPKISATVKKKGVPEGIWSKCTGCEAVLYRAELERNLFVCPKCNHHLRLTARQRLDLFLDPEDRVELAQDVLPQDRLKFRDSKKYKDRLSAAQKETNESEALVVTQGKLNGLPLIACAFEFNFIGGSMSSAVGQRFVMAVEAAIQYHVPLICFSTSGGARMQEGLFSLFQMAKTAAALTQLSQAQLPFIS